jgi:hypothetical protein
LFLLSSYDIFSTKREHKPSRDYPVAKILHTHSGSIASKSGLKATPISFKNKGYADLYG